MWLLLVALVALCGLALLSWLYLRSHHTTTQLRQQLQQQQLQQTLHDYTLQQSQLLQEVKLHLQQQLADSRALFAEQQQQALQQLQTSLYSGIGELRMATADSLERSAKSLREGFDQLTQVTAEHILQISQQVEQRLNDGFAKTTATFTDVVQRLAIIDEAQKRIAELSSNVVNLQQILADKRTRGAFGEVQLTSLLRNVLPETHFSLQHTLSNGKRCDCILFLPEPSGNIVIDAKFPLENFQRLMNAELSSVEKNKLEQQFRQDIKHHIQSIASKYIIPTETADGAILFIPAEAIFAEIHAHYPDLVAYAHAQRVWLTSPTTIMAILTTARAVIKDAATRQQVHIIQEHLLHLAKDFTRFRQRMDALAKHIQLANDDVKDVHVSAHKIGKHFDKIEQVQLEPTAHTLTTSTTD